ncbi:MAG: GIY-YIG nuclease family protein [Patescibacteria group bacterium]
MNYYVYILELCDKSHYIGSTPDIDNRLREHQSGYCLSTKGKLPCIMIWHGCFNDKLKALRFEKYLKSGSGRAFRHKRFE